MESNPCEILSLLDIVHPVAGPFFRYGETALRLGHDYEEDRYVVLTILLQKYFM